MFDHYFGIVRHTSIVVLQIANLLVFEVACFVSHCIIPYLSTFDISCPKNTWCFKTKQQVKLPLI